ncbi:MAG: 16S rRNA (guanine(527)-N(7))-methyltransferase RsmG [Miltoncostaeaceae bacterium]
MGTDGAAVSRETRAAAQLLVARCEGMGLALGPEPALALIELTQALLAQPHNLTSIGTLSEAIDRHLADSLSVLTLPEIADTPDFLDLGSGGGFPGLPLAAARPGVAVTLVESSRKKAEWLERASARFPNVRVVPERSETLALHERERSSTVGVRAVASPPAALELAAPLVRPSGTAVLWRGRRDAADIAAGDRAAEALGFDSAIVSDVAPFPAAQRHFLIYRKTDPTDPSYPRRPGRATSRPLA